jgi:putative Holliday junction resolvase
VGRILAVDWGERRLGLAVSDPMGWTAQGLPSVTLERPADAAAAVCRAVAEHEAERLVLGLPLELSGDAGEAAQIVLALARELATRLTIPIETWDERFTSVIAERSLREEGRRTSGRRGGGRERARTRPPDKGRIDQRAAVLLLQSWLDAHARRGDAP